jgi:hypothetical protein
MTAVMDGFVTEQTLHDIPDTFVGRLRRLDPGRGLFVVLAAWYTSVPMRRDDVFQLLDYVDLAIHEAGHVVFSPFGDFAGIAGGSLLLVIVPLAFVAWFAVVRQRYAACIVVFWVAQSLLNLARYIADARAQELPLIGGEYAIHDWSWMLSRMHLLTHDTDIAAAVRLLAGFLWFAAIPGALHFAVRPGREAPPGRSGV